jgi:hypothetical protein
MLFSRYQCIDQADLRPDAAFVFGDQDLRLVVRFASRHIVLAAPGIENRLQECDILWWYGGDKMLHRYPSQGRQHQSCASIVCAIFSDATLV